MLQCRLRSRTWQGLGSREGRREPAGEPPRGQSERLSKQGNGYARSSQCPCRGCSRRPSCAARLPRRRPPGRIAREDTERVRQESGAKGQCDQTRAARANLFTICVSECSLTKRRTERTVCEETLKKLDGAGLGDRLLREPDHVGLSDTVRELGGKHDALDLMTKGDNGLVREEKEKRVRNAQ